MRLQLSQTGRYYNDQNLTFFQHDFHLQGVIQEEICQIYFFSSVQCFEQVRSEDPLDKNLKIGTTLEDCAK